MAVLLYQIGIFITIQSASLFGKSARNTAVFLITIFTLLQVFMSWLLILQLITIFISYNFSKRWFEKNTTKQTRKEPNNMMHKYRENVGHSISEADKNDTQMQNAIDTVLNNISMRAKGIHPSQTNGINLKTKFFYIDHCKTYGPVSAEKLIRLVKNNQINKNCFVRQQFEKEYEKRAYEIVELFH